MCIGNDHTGSAEDPYRHQRYPVSAVTIQQSAYKKLRYAVTDQEQAQGKLGLAIGNAKRISHARQGRNINICCKTRHGYHGKRQNGGHPYITILYPLRFNSAGRHFTVAGDSFPAKLLTLNKE